MSRRSRRGLQVLLLIAVGWLAGCTTSPGPASVDTSALEERARAATAAGDDRTAADIYTQLASVSSGAARIDFRLEAAGAEIRLRNWFSARELLNQARSGAAAGQLERVELLSARIELGERQPDAALARVTPLLSSADTAIRAEALEVQGLAQFATNRPVEAVESLSEREIWLDDINAIRENQRAIWLNLFSVSASQRATGDEVVDGWLALAPIARIAEESAQHQALLEWRTTYRQHPAARILLTDLLGVSASEAGAPRQIALLLPLSTNAREPARAIRDGFMAAHMAAARDSNLPTRDIAVRVYDTGSEGAESAYRRAQVDGADFVVGPLLREEVQAVLLQSGIVPTLTLNHTLGEEEVFGNTYQFALAPEDEAVAVARRAVAQGQLRAVALLPSNDRGYRIYNRFREEYEALGGEVLDFMGYDGAIGTYGNRISILLNLDRSNDRERTLQANLREDVEFAPRRRQDIDMIFLIANAADGRQLAPQLEYYYAGDIPTYAISEIHDPAARDRTADLNRVIFPEVPWIIGPGGDALRAQQTIASRWPERSVPMARFFGMGLDSYRIVSTLYRDPFFTAIEGSTGLLRMDTQGRIHRDLPFAQFRSGDVELLEPLPQSSEQMTPTTAPFSQPPGAPSTELEPIPSFLR